MGRPSASRPALHFWTDVYKSLGGHTSLDKVALALGLGGVVLAIFVAMVGRMLGQDFAMMAYGIFVAFEVAAIVLGIITRGTPIGKTAAITSSVLLIGSVMFIV